MVSVIRSVDTSHEDMIHDAQLDYYGTKLATCSSDRSIKIFDVTNDQQTLIETLRGHEGPVWQLAWAHPMFGNMLASCGYDRKVIIWKETNSTWEKLYEYAKSHDSSVNSVSFAPHEYGLMLACGSSDGYISVITSSGDGNWESSKHTAHTIGCNAVSWAPATPANALFDQGNQQQRVKRFVSGGCDFLVKIWREDNGQWVEEHKLDGHSDWVRDVAWAPSVGLSKSVIASCSQDCRVIIWTNDRVSNTWTSKVLHKFDDVVWHVSWSTTGNILAVSGGDNKTTLWKENLEGQWVCISDVNKGQGQIGDSHRPSSG